MLSAVREAISKSAYLRNADLRNADLRNAKGINKYLTTPLYVLRDQPGAIRSYKMVDANLRSPIHPATIQYAIGATYEIQNANTDENELCGAGINLATGDRIAKNYYQGYRVLIAEHTAADIAAIPIGSDGKYRVFRAKIVGEKPLAELGILENKK
jgi:hypothetical protein